MSTSVRSLGIDHLIISGTGGELKGYIDSSQGVTCPLMIECSLLDDVSKF